MRCATLLLFLSAIATLLCTIGGCGSSGPDLGEVTGTVTLDGKPLSNATLIFRSQAPNGTTSMGVTGPNGKYKLMFTADKTGAMLGKHDVEITTRQLSETDVESLKAQGKTPPPFTPIPQKYKEPGTLLKDVVKGKNTIDFDLASK